MSSNDAEVDFRLYQVFQSDFRREPSGITLLYRDSPGLAKLAALSVLTADAAQEKNLRDPLEGLEARHFKRFLPLVSSFDFSRQLHSSQIAPFVGMYRAWAESGWLMGWVRDFTRPFRPFVSETWIQGKALYESVNEGLLRLNATKKASLAYRSRENFKRYFKFTFLTSVNGMLIYAGQFPSIVPEFAMLRGLRFDDEDWATLRNQGEKAFVAQVLAKHPVRKWSHVVTRFLERVTIMGSTVAYVSVIGMGMYNGYEARHNAVQAIANDPLIRLEYPVLAPGAEREAVQIEGFRRLFDDTIRELCESNGNVFDPQEPGYVERREAFAKERIKKLKARTAESTQP